MKFSILTILLTCNIYTIAQSNYRQHIAKYRIASVKSYDEGVWPTNPISRKPTIVYYSILGYDSVVKDGFGLQSKTIFDAMGQPSKVINYSSGKPYDTTFYTYNDDGSYKAIKDYILPEYKPEIIYFNSQDRRTRHLRNDSLSIAYFYYDSIGYLSRQVYAGNTGDSSVIHFVNTYDEKGQLLKRVQMNDGKQRSEWHYQYDDRGFVVRLQIFYDEKKFNRNIRSVYTVRK